MLSLIVWLLAAVYVLACVWLVIVVLLQEGKSGGFGAADGGGGAPAVVSDTFGASGAQKGLFNMTAWTAGIFFALALIINVLALQRDRDSSLDLGTAPAASATTSTTTTAPAATGDAPAAAAPAAPAAPAATP